MTPVVDTAAIRKVLVIKLRAVGDVVLSTIVLQNLRAAFSNASLEFLTERAGGDVLRDHPLLDSVLVYDRKQMSGLGLILDVRRRNYDLVLDLFCNPRTALITRLSGARYRVGYRFRGRSYAYNLLVSPRGGEVHNTQFNLDALERIGVPTPDRALHIVPRQQDEGQAGQIWNALSPGNRQVLAVNAGGGWEVKRWPLDRFAELADRMIEATGCRIMLLWGPGEEDNVAVIRSKMRHQALVPPKTSLLEMAALLRKCALVVSNDSGPMHIGAAMGVPVLGIFGPTSPRLQGPYGSRGATVQLNSLTCLGCNLTTCPIGNPCMKNLDVQTVLDAALGLLRRSPQPEEHR